MSVNKPNINADNARLESLGVLDNVFSDSDAASHLQQISHTSYGAASRFWQSAFSAEPLSPRMKELVLVALHATVTSLNSEAVRRHVGRAITAGASEQDVLDVLITIAGAANHALYFAVPVLMRELEAVGHPQAELPPVTEKTQAIKDEFIRSRGFWNEQRDAIVRAMPEYFAALSDLSTESWKNGTLTLKERELICIAIDCSVTHMYEPGLVIHIRSALKHGASREEILTVFHLASLTGLEGYILGGRGSVGKVIIVIQRIRLIFKNTSDMPVIFCKPPCCHALCSQIAATSKLVDNLTGFKSSNNY